MMTNKTTWKRFSFPLLATVAAIGLYFPLSRFCEKKTDTFNIGAISSNPPFEPAWQTHPLSSDKKSELEHALSQKYRYFGKGGQCYAFFSEDGNYVIKFFKQRVYKIPLWHHFILVGRFIANEQMKSKEMCSSELVRITMPFKKWPNNKDPDLASYCDEAVAKAIAAL